MGVETKMVSENLRNANSMQIPQHRYYVSLSARLPAACPADPITTIIINQLTKLSLMIEEQDGKTTHTSFISGAIIPYLRSLQN